MPLTITGDRLDQYIEGLNGRLNSPDLAIMLANDLAESLSESFTASGLQSKSGAGLRALTTVGEPERTGNGWSIGVGDRSALGDEGDPAPSGVLGQFQKDYGLRPSSWKEMPPTYKDTLESLRRSGMYGGRGPLYANYMWVQDKGNVKANITARGFIDTGVATWKSHADNIVSEWWTSLGTFGRIKQSILGFFRR